MTGHLLVDSEGLCCRCSQQWMGLKGPVEPEEINHYSEAWLGGGRRQDHQRCTLHFDLHLKHFLLKKKRTGNVAIIK